MAVASPADLRAARGVVVALPAPESGAASAEPRSRVREKFATRPAGSLRKRPPLSVGPSSSRQPVPPRKKPRDVPGISFSICQGCRVDTGSSDALEVLESKWRALLLCSGCLRAVRSRDACAYCFEKFSGEDPRRRVMDCVDCRCRVHLVCIPGQRGYITPYDLDPALFSCADCSAIPMYFQPPRVRSPKPDCSPAVVKGMMKDLVRDANAYLKRKTIMAELAKQKAMDKAEAAKVAADQARDAFDFALLASQGSSSSSGGPMGPKVADQELALRLHLAMNGSQRITRCQHSLNHQNLTVKSKQAVPNGYIVGQKLGTDQSNVEEVKVILEDESHAKIDGLGTGPLDSKVDAEGPSSSSLTNSSSRNIDASVGEGKIVDVTDSECLSASITRSDGSIDEQCLVEVSVEGLVDESFKVDVQLTSSTTPDRYLKKYTRNNRVKRTSDNEGITGLLPALAACSSCLNTSRDFSGASFDKPVLAMGASANVSGSSSCQ